MNNSVHIARAMLLIFIVSVIGSCSSTKSLYSKEYLMTHNDTTVYDNVYLVDTIEIPNPRVISLYPLWGKSEYSFVADSALAMKIVEEMQRLHTWSDFFKYLKNSNSLINSCYVYWIPNDYSNGELYVLMGRNKKKGRKFISLVLSPSFEEEFTPVGNIDGQSIVLCKFTPDNVRKFMLFLVNVGFLDMHHKWVLDGPPAKIRVPSTIMPYNKYIKIVYPVSPE